CQQENNWPYSF
nr:immunoglobulin light chain junction region [Macaca mulatta]MOV74595.1 immunoglobulin light chain junction region [Macaca mulatta]MOV74671.1 immunoglobulin light chain junction region [Macaca mulatta]MOV74730.1 immunoglobulin light chain junction region [Macaca mulatta]MOV74936.1 immunoglobulin light chain junction region [Macaca mulatta]